MKLGLLTTIFLFNINTLLAQNFANLGADANLSPTLFKTIVPDKPILGSQNLKDNWVPGSITTLSGKNFYLPSINYNIYLKKIIFLQDNQQYSLNQNINIKRFNIGKNLFVYTPYDNDTKFDFFEELVGEGKLILLKLYGCELVIGQPDYGVTPGTPDKFVINEDYYVKLEGGELTEVNIKKAEILMIMNDHKTEINQYIKSNKIKFKDESDLIELFEYYNLLN